MDNGINASAEEVLQEHGMSDDEIIYFQSLIRDEFRKLLAQLQRQRGKAKSDCTIADLNRFIAASKGDLNKEKKK